MGPDSIAAFIDGLPKAELHLHIEGTLEPEMVFDLADRNGIALPYASVEALRAAYRFANLQAFLDLYYQASQVLRTARDFNDLTRAYMAQAKLQNIRHAEIFFDPQTHTHRGVAMPDIIDGIWDALREAEREDGITSRLILCFLRDLAPADAMATLEAALPYGDRIAGIGLDSAEVGNPPELFSEVFARARAEGFPVVAHAGEEGPATYVTGALDELQVLRIDHGVRSIDDPILMQRLAAERVPLTVCPLSNQRLGVTPDLSDHPLRALMEAGVVVTVNSDDPAYFGGHVNANYLAIQEALGLDREELAGLARASFAASWLDETDKAARIREVDVYCNGG